MTDWTAEDVKRELAKAFRVLGVTTPRSSAGGKSGFWPTYFHEADEIAEQQMMARLENRKPRRRYSSGEIARMERVLLGDASGPGWLVRWLSGQEGIQRCLTWWAIWVAQDREVKEECRRKRWAYSTFRRKRDHGAQIIADALNAAGAPLPG